jgi:membrane-associated phospholipid phosphatase
MKSALKKIGAAAVSAIAISVVVASCSKSVPTSEPLPIQAPAAQDANAGSWKMVLLTGPTQIPVAAPAPVSDPSYQAELASIQGQQAAMSPAQYSTMQYWSAGGALRWNEILRELVAHADLPPAPNPDGSYPSPNPANPFADPQYPFSNPPYAARAYSYVSLAQYEALKVAWYYKYQYNRPSPYVNSSSITSLMPKTGLPSYPSEDAVEAGVNGALLMLLFPTSASEIKQKMADQQQSALLSGRASASDLAAGLALGQAVAAIFKARAATDGMKAAAGNAAVWQALAAGAAAQGQVPWISQDVPPRPPMLPLFGKVQPWIMTTNDIVSVRPGPPPSTGSTQMQQELAEVKNAVAKLTDDQRATVYKWSDGVSTVTPAGHWNAIAVPYITAAKLSDVRTARVFALVNMAMMDAAVSCWDTKYTYFNPRPTQLDPSIKTEIALPNFPSYVSGHSMFSGAGADVLSYLFPSGSAYFTSQMQEAAMSRLYGGIHYRSDIEVGLTAGKSVGDYIVTFAQNDGAD